MLVMSHERYALTTANMITLQGSDNAYYYISRDVYDQAVLLGFQFDKDLKGFCHAVNSACDEVPAICQKFYDTTPDPVRNLAPFLTLVDGYQSIDSVEEACGALSIVSMSISFRRFIFTPETVRSSVRFSLTIREEYRLSWEHFFQTNPTMALVEEAFKRKQIVEVPVGTAPAVAPAEEEEEEIDMSNVTFVNPVASTDELLKTIMGDTFSAEPAAPAAPAAPAPKSGFDRIRGL